MHLFRKIGEVGLINTFVGSCRMIYYKQLSKKYSFDPCHLSTYELREYLQAVAKYVNNDEKVQNQVIDVGCGLGELLRHINAPNRIGIDMDSEAIRCATFLDKSKSIEFKSGSFEMIGQNNKVDYLIVLGFMHGSPERTWQAPFAKATSENDIKNIVVDVFKENPENGTRHLDFTKVLPENYRLIDRMGPFLGEKYVEVYSKEV